MVKWVSKNPTGALVLDDGTIFKGFGFGAIGKSSGEVCFNTAISGYQEIMTDPSYCSQIITFTFPHIGNVGLNSDEMRVQINLISVEQYFDLLLQIPRIGDLK